MARGLLLAGLVAIVTATATPSLVENRLELVATAEAKEPKRSIDAKALELIDGFDENGTYSNLQSGNYDQVLRDYQDDADVLMKYDLDSLQGERRRIAGVIINNVATALKESNRCSEALSYFSFALLLNPDSLSNHSGMGFCYVKMKRWQEALEEYQLALEFCEDKSCRDNISSYITKIEKILK